MRPSPTQGEEQLALAAGLADSELYRYNGFNQLTSAVVGGKTVTYTYYPSGLRATKAIRKEVESLA
jgi:hypothetical protein